MISCVNKFLNKICKKYIHIYLYIFNEFISFGCTLELDKKIIITYHMIFIDFMYIFILNYLNKIIIFSIF